jgi:predicted ribonuclease YlaK
VDVSLPEGMQPNSQDNRILKVCKGLWNQGESVILVTRDIVVRIKAQMKGSPLSVQLTMLPDECVRSDLAFDAAQRM